MNLKKRVEKIEKLGHYYSDNRPVEDMTTAELEKIITTQTGIPACDLTDEVLEDIIKNARREHKEVEKERKEKGLATKR